MAKLGATTTLLLQLIMYSAVSAADAVFHERFTDHSDIPKLRQWVWQHWSHRKAATATLKWLTVEGDSGTSDYTIGKDRDGVWYLSVHLQGSDRLAEDTRYWRDQWTIAYSVARTEEPYQNDWPGKPIQHSRPLPARKFVLELKDKEGKILSHI
jgi:hypothetical protein